MNTIKRHRRGWLFAYQVRPIRWVAVFWLTYLAAVIVVPIVWWLL
ncbi:MAG TPA: hypothetical protein PLN31_17260 [Azoarcus taiwanensis]|nr:hypothetical protein [Azoarcus taiwanensis]